ncbi:MAG: LuxR C-terminal-related transcriptional regulator [Acidiferrobacterales bacterium]
MTNLADLLFRTVDGVFAVNAKQKIVFWNSGCAQLFGVPTNEALGRPCCQVVRGKDPTGQPFCGGGCCMSRLNHGEDIHGTFPLRVHNGEGKELRFSVNIVLVPSRRKDRWTCVHLLHREGAANTLDMMEYNSNNHNRPSPLTISTLTAREQEILQLLAEGLAVPVMSELLNVSRVTVRNHLQHIQAKLGVHSQAETVAYAYRHNLVQY